MTSNRNSYRTAALLLECHGDTAPIFAAMEADRQLDAGDLEGAATWRRIVKAIHDLTEGTRH